MRIGVDEAGRGPAIGPLVVAAFAAPSAEIDSLLALGVDDSKALSRSQRLRVETALTAGAEAGRWSYGIVEASAERIDRAMSVQSLNDLEVVLFAEAISSIDGGLEGTVSKVLALDACDTDAERFGRRVQARLDDRWSDWHVDSQHGMDARDVIVGAASIIAKVSRDAAIERLSESLGFSVGSGYPSDPATVSAIERLVMDEAPHPALRWRWAPVRRAWRLRHHCAAPDRPAPEDGRIGDQATLDRF